MTTAADPGLSLLSHPDAAAFRARICREPECDAHRLVFADWVDENGDGEWAEFIRCQVELDAMRRRFATAKCNIAPLTPKCECVGCHLQRRESTLLPHIEPRLRRGLRCERCRDGLEILRYTTIPGFGKNIPVTDADIKCSTCSGRGWLGVLSGWHKAEVDRTGTRRIEGWDIPARWERGFPAHITCTLDWWQRNGGQCVREWPCLPECSDKRPEDDRGFMWFVGTEGESEIPLEIWKLLPGMELTDWGDDYKGFPTEPAARLALSAALRAWAWGKG